MKQRKVIGKCPVCGEEISEDDVICPSCDSLVQEPAYDAVSDEQDEEEDN